MEKHRLQDNTDKVRLVCIFYSEEGFKFIRNVFVIFQENSFSFKMQNAKEGKTTKGN